MTDHHLAASSYCLEGPKLSPPEGLPAAFLQGEHSSAAWLSENFQDADLGREDRVWALVEDKSVKREELREWVNAIDWELLAGPRHLETSERREEAPALVGARIQR